MQYGKPWVWFLEIMRVLETHRIEDANQLTKVLETVPRLPNDWSGY